MPTIVKIAADGTPVKFTKAYSRSETEVEKIYAERHTCAICDRKFWAWPDKPNDYCQHCIASDPSLLKPLLYKKPGTDQDQVTEEEP